MRHLLQLDLFASAARAWQHVEGIQKCNERFWGTLTWEAMQENHKISLKDARTNSALHGSLVDHDHRSEHRNPPLPPMSMLRLDGVCG